MLRNCNYQNTPSVEHLVDIRYCSKIIFNMLNDIKRGDYVKLFVDLSLRNIELNKLDIRHIFLGI